MKISQHISTLAWMALLAVLFVGTVKTQRSWERIARPVAVGDLEALHVEIVLAQQQREQAQTTVVVAAAQNEVPPTVVLPQRLLGHGLPAPEPLVNERAAADWHPEVALPPVRNHWAVRAGRLHGSAAPSLYRRVVAATGVEDSPTDVALSRPADSRGALLSQADLPLPTVTEDLFAPTTLVAQQPAPAVARSMRTQQVIMPEEPVVADALSAEAHSLAWTRPVRLIADLEKLATSPACGEWALRVIDTLEQLNARPRPGQNLSQQLLDDLTAEVELAYSIDRELPESVVRTQLRLARHALRRRVEIWRTTHNLVVERYGRTQINTADTARLAACVAELDQIVTGDSQGEGWRQFLLLDSLQAMTGWQSVGKIDPQARELAELVLQRLDNQQLTAGQRAFLESAPVTRLEHELRHWIGEPLKLAELLGCMEVYEESGSAADAMQLATWTDQLLTASDPELKKLGQRLETHYRNHNMRVNVSADLVNRFLPALETRQGRVRDTILGLPVSGSQRTDANMAVELEPDNRGLTVKVKVDGTVAANTCACSGPATMYSQSRSRYTAITPVRIDSQGIRFDRPSVRVDTSTRLRGLQTDLDDVPLLGAMARLYAHNKIDASQDEAQREIEYKVSRQIQRELSAELGQRVADLETELESRVVHPLTKLDLHPLLVAMNSTEDRMVVRGRMAAAEQLGAHTPRPQALNDSLASFQIHESALNNAIDRLGLNGREFSPEELQAFLAEQLSLPSDEAPKLVGRSVKFKFASHEPVRVRCDDRKVQMTIRLDKVDNGRQHATDVVVRVSYMPQVDGRSVDLIRDGSVSIEGEGLRGRSYLAIRAIFTKMFPKQRPWETVPDSVWQDERLADLGITQFVIRDGWIGASIGPKRELPEDVQTAKGPLRRRIR